MDVYNGDLVNWRMASRPVFEMVSSMLEAALPRAGCAVDPVAHSDQGWHCKMQSYRAMLVRRGVEQSRNRKGNCFDNAVLDDVFGPLEAEYFHLAAPNSIDALEASHTWLRPLLQPRAHQTRTARTPPGGVPTEKNRLIGGIVTV